MWDFILNDTPRPATCRHFFFCAITSSVISSPPLPLHPVTFSPSASLHPLSRSIYVGGHSRVGGGPRSTVSYTHTHTHSRPDAHREGSNPTFCEPCGSHCCIICCNCVLFEKRAGLHYLLYYLECACVCWRGGGGGVKSGTLLGCRDWSRVWAALKKKKGRLMHKAHLTK